MNPIDKTVCVLLYILLKGVACVPYASSSTLPTPQHAYTQPAGPYATVHSWFMKQPGDVLYTKYLNHCSQNVVYIQMRNPILYEGNTQ